MPGAVATTIGARLEKSRYAFSEASPPAFSRISAIDETGAGVTNTVEEYRLSLLQRFSTVSRGVIAPATSRAALKSFLRRVYASDVNPSSIDQGGGCWSFRSAFDPRSAGPGYAGTNPYIAPHGIHGSPLTRSMLSRPTLTCWMGGCGGSWASRQNGSDSTVARGRRVRSSAVARISQFRSGF